MAYQGYQAYNSYEQQGYGAAQSGGYRPPKPISVTIVPQGASSVVEVGGGSFDIKEDLKTIGCRFDGNKKVWFVEVPAAEAEQVIAQIQQFANGIGSQVDIKNSPGNAMRQPLQQSNSYHQQNVGYGAQQGGQQQYGGSSRFQRGVKINFQQAADGSQTVIVSGQTFDVKDQLKPLGFRFQGDTKSWACSGVLQEQIAALKQDVESICQQHGISLQF